jgi:glycosyltransferase involved in cell wall biosynthesis
LRHRFFAKPSCPNLFRNALVRCRYCVPFGCFCWNLESRISALLFSFTKVDPPDCPYYTIRLAKNTINGIYFAAGGRLVGYKRFDLIVKVFNRLQWPLKIFGDGPEYTGLKKIAKPNIEFLGHISDEEKTNVLSGARAFIHPQMEDFGITAVEAMACGRPVIAFSQGGATETVLPNETGIFFHSQTWEALLDTVLHFNHENWDSAKIREHAAKFDAHNFKVSIKKYINDRYEEFQKGLNQETLLTHVPSL